MTDEASSCPRAWDPVTPKELSWHCLIESISCRRKIARLNKSCEATLICFWRFNLRPWTRGSHMYNDNLSHFHQGQQCLHTYDVLASGTLDSGLTLAHLNQFAVSC